MYVAVPDGERFEAEFDVQRYGRILHLTKNSGAMGFGVELLSVIFKSVPAPTPSGSDTELIRTSNLDDGELETYVP